MGARQVQCCANDRACVLPREGMLPIMSLSPRYYKYLSAARLGGEASEIAYLELWVLLRDEQKPR